MVLICICLSHSFPFILKSWNHAAVKAKLKNGKFYYVNYGPVIEEVEKNPKEIIMDVVPPVNQTAINKANEEATRKIQQEKSGCS